MSYLTYPIPTPEDYPKFTSETAKYRHLTAAYCIGCGVDLASQGDAVVPWALSFDLPQKDFDRYCGGHPAKGPIHLRGYAEGRLPFDSDSLSFLYSSHFLEDVSNWIPVLTEWTRVVAVGGNLIILIPDKTLWGAAVSAGQPPNCAHRHEGRVGELSETFAMRFRDWEVIEDRLTALYPGDYTILFVATRMK